MVAVRRDPEKRRLSNQAAEERRKRHPNYPAYRRNIDLQTKYNVTLAWLEAALAKQGGCAICGSREHRGRGWCVDHNHACCPGRYSCGICVRGVLCFPCNVAIGNFNDNVDALLAAVEYLERYK